MFLNGITKINGIINFYGEYLIDIGKICIENNILSRRQMANVKEMLEQTERMMKNVK